MYLGEMLLLVSGKDLHMVKVLNRAFVAGLYVKLLEKCIGEVWSVSARSGTKQERRRERFGGVEDSRDIAVEGE